MVRGHVVHLTLVCARRSRRRLRGSWWSGLRSIRTTRNHRRFANQKGRWDDDHDHRTPLECEFPIPLAEEAKYPFSTAAGRRLITRHATIVGARVAAR